MNDFYVDNLVKTSNSLEHLVKLYQDSLVRMSEGNFSLKYNTNNESLRELIKKENDKTNTVLLKEVKQLHAEVSSLKEARGHKQV